MNNKDNNSNNGTHFQKLTIILYYCKNKFKNKNVFLSWSSKSKMMWFELVTLVFATYLPI